MSGTRASIFDTDDTDPLDVSGFAPKPGVDKTAPAAEEVRVVAEASNFRRRQAPAPITPPPASPRPAKHQPRIYRTGRTVQFNVKMSQETHDTLYAISDEQGWKLVETMERAVAALKQSLAGK
jgi:hypothetical protein